MWLSSQTKYIVENVRHFFEKERSVGKHSGPHPEIFYSSVALLRMCISGQDFSHCKYTIIQKDVQYVYMDVYVIHDYVQQVNFE